MRTIIGIRHRRSAATAAMALLLALAGLLAADPAAAGLRSFFTDSGGTYTCGSPAIGMRGVLNFSGAPNCTTDATLEIPPAASGTIATFYSSSFFSTTRATKVRGNELFVDMVADTPGEIVFEFGYGANTASFSPIGSARVVMNWARDPQGHRVDLSGVWGQVPMNMYLVLRIRKSALSPFSGRLFLHNMPPVGGPTFSSIRGSVYDGAWTVGKSGADLPTLAAALTDSRVLAEDRLYLKPDTYTGAGYTGVNFSSKALMVVGEEGPEKTIIDCGYSTWAFRFSSGATSTSGLDGLTIRRANSSSVLLSGTASPLIRNCVFRDNDSAGASGGAIRLNATGAMASAARVEDCRFVGNRSSSADTALGNGGAIAVEAGAGVMARLTISRSTFLRNAAVAFGGAVYVSADTAEVQILDSVFVENAAAYGGALSASDIGAVLVERCRFERNYAMAAGAALSRRVLFLSSVFQGNIAAGSAGAVLASGGTLTVHTVLNYCTLTGNGAASAGGVSVGTGGFVTIANSILWGDWQTDGSPLGIEVAAPSATARVSHSIVQGGRAAMRLPPPTIGSSAGRSSTRTRSSRSGIPRTSCPARPPSTRAWLRRA